MAYVVDDLDVRGQVTASNLSGSIKEVLDLLSETFGVFYSYRGGVFRFSTKRQFVLALPPIEGQFADITAVVRQLGIEGQDPVIVDRPNRLITFRTTRKGYDRIREYVDYVRRTKNLIVYDAYLWEVELRDKTEGGIQWDQWGCSVCRGHGSAQLRLTAARPGRQAHSALPPRLQEPWF